MTEQGVPSVADPGADGRLRTIRVRLYLALGAMFVVTMTVAGPLMHLALAEAGEDPTYVLRLAVLGVALPAFMAAMARRIVEPATALDEAHERLRSLYNQARLDSLVDPISGLGNHRAFQEELRRQVELARRHDHSVALALIDLDDLKQINDKHGHAVGDVLLGTVGRLITTTCRAGDRGFRIGGDEFAILMPHAEAGNAQGVVKRILSRALGNEPVKTGGSHFSFSAGVSAYPDPAGDGKELFHQADAALYWAKRHGRTDVQAFDPKRHASAPDTRTVPELAEAIVSVAERRAVSPIYQPIYDLQTGTPVGFEGLVRPTHDAGFRDAGKLFAAAEAANRTVELDLVCMEAIAAGGGWADASHYLSFNVSPRSLETEQFSVSRLTKLFRKYKIAPAQVVLELTERAAIEDMPRLRQNLEACREAGMRIAADDVGAGNAGLRLLSEIRFDIVKIDLSLVQGGVLRDSALAVLRAIHDLAGSSGASVVAEGIETVEQLKVVRQLGVKQGQGFLLAHPAEQPVYDPIDLDLLLANHETTRLAFLDLSA
jgi:diguanylate cyclase (GGDEF)-like protein